MTVPQLEKYAEQLLKICSKPQQWDKDFPFKERSAAVKSHQAVKLSSCHAGNVGSLRHIIIVKRCLPLFLPLLTFPAPPPKWIEMRADARLLIVQSVCRAILHRAVKRALVGCQVKEFVFICSDYLFVFGPVDSIVSTRWWIIDGDNLIFKYLRHICKYAIPGSPMAHGKQSESQVGENHKSKKKWVSKFDFLSAPFSWVILLLVGYCQGMENLTK